MSSSVCQGFQSCLEPRHSSVRNKTPNTEKNDNNGSIKNSFDDSENKNNKNGELGGWNFIQALTNIAQTTQKSTENDADKEKVYVHPLVKRSASMLSEKSLEMCTESLGSETGSDISENMEENHSYLSDNADFSPKTHSKNRGISSAGTKKTCRRGGGNFPPPLISISGLGCCFRMKPHREGGRLVIKAVTVSSSRTFFHVERGNGRLKLHLLKEISGDSDIKAAAEKREEAIEDNNDDEVEELEEDGDVEAEDETEEDEGDVKWGCDDSVCWGEEIDGDGEDVGGEIGMDKFQKPSRCKEGEYRDKRLWNLEAFWVASASS